MRAPRRNSGAHSAIAGPLCFLVLPRKRLRQSAHLAARLCAPYLACDLLPQRAMRESRAAVGVRSRWSRYRACAESLGPSATLGTSPFRAAHPAMSKIRLSIATRGGGLADPCMNAMCTPEPGHYRCVMPLWRLRDYDDDDLDQAIQISESVNLFRGTGQQNLLSSLLGVVGPVDPCFGWERGWPRWLCRRSVPGGRRTRHRARSARFVAGDFGGAVVNVGGRVKCQPGVAMLIVVPREKRVADRARILDRPEPVRKFGPIFERPELGFGKRIVVADARARVGLAAIPRSANRSATTLLRMGAPRSAWIVNWTRADHLPPSHT